MKIGLIDVDGYNGKYKVSPTGDIYSMYRFANIHGEVRRIDKVKKLSPCVDKKGYLVVNLYDENGNIKSKKVHRLVAEAFLPNPQGKRCVCHKDNNPKNCDVDNLYWGTDLENQRQAWRDGRHKRIQPVISLNESNEVVSVYESQSDASRKTGIPQANIWKCLNGERKTAGGLKWRRLD